MSMRKTPYPEHPFKVPYARDFWASRGLTIDEMATFQNAMQDYGDDLIDSIILGDHK